MEQHGDYQCLDKDGGLDCLMQATPPGTAKWFNTELSTDGEVNDVRPPRSEKLKFWMEYAFRWTPNLKKVDRQVSVEIVGQPGIMDIVKAQTTRVGTYPCPTDQKNLMWFTGLMPSTGTMTHSRMHAHASIFHSAYMFSATPEELGLDDPKFMPVKSYIPLDLKDLGYNTIDGLVERVFDNFEKSIKKNPSKPPKLICRVAVGGVIIDGFIYDRRPPMQCNDWSFKEGEPFTVLGFTQHQGFPVGAHDPDHVPEMSFNHVLFAIYMLDEPTRTSHFDLSFYSQTGFVFGTRSLPTFLDVLFMIFWYGGVLQASTQNQIHTWFLPVAVTLLLLLIGSMYLCIKRFCCGKKSVVAELKKFTGVEYVQLPVSDMEAEAEDGL